MTVATLPDLVAGRADDPGVRLLMDTTAALRADADFLARADDVAGAEFLSDEVPAALETAAFQDVLARIDTARSMDAAAIAAAGNDPRRAEIAALPSPVREAALAALHKQRRRLRSCARPSPIGLTSREGRSRSARLRSRVPRRPTPPPRRWLRPPAPPRSPRRSLGSFLSFPKPRRRSLFQAQRKWLLPRLFSRRYFLSATSSNR